MKIFYWLLLILLPVTLSAQRDMPLRFELEAAKDADDYTGIPIGEKGFIVFYEGNLVGQDSSSWVFIQYDTNLKKMAHHAVTMPINLHYVTGEYANDHIYLVFQENFQRRTVPKTYYVDMELQNFTFQKREIENLSDQNISFLRATGQSLVLISYEKNQYGIYLYDMIRNQLKNPELTTGQIVSVEFCEVDTIFSRILWGVAISSGGKNSYLQLIETDFQGNKTRETNYPSFTDYYYNSTRLTVLDTGLYLIMGTFTDGNDRYKGDMHSGVYTMNYKNVIIEEPQFFHYTHVKSKDTVGDGKSKDRNSNLQLSVGPIYRLGDQYALVTEVFYPEYSYNYAGSGYDPYYYGYNSMPATSTFVGYRYINAYVTAFDRSGNLLWGNYLPFSNILTQRLTHRVNVYPLGNSAMIYYLFNSSLTYTMVNGEDVIEPLTTVRLETNHNRDAVEYSRNPKLEHWYGDYFVAYGYQYIRNNSKGVKSKRYVFFANKLICK